MKLIGSKTEQDFRKELIKSHKSLFQDEEEQRLLGILKTYFPDMKTAYVIGWTPEQSEDIYRILINTDIIAGIEMDRFNSDTEPLVEKITIHRYKQNVSKMVQIKLAVAMDLAQKFLNSSTENPKIGVF